MRRLIRLDVWCGIAAAAAAWCVGFTATAQAQLPAQDEVRLGGSVVSGGLGKFQADRWGLVKAQVRNNADVAGEFRVTWAFNDDAQRQFVRKVWLPAHAARSLVWPARLGEVVDTGKPVLSADGRAICLAAEREVSYSEQPGSIMVDTEPWSTVIVTGPDDLRTADGVVTIREVAGLGRRLTYPMGGSKALPRFTLGWEPARVMVVADPNLSLDAAQRRAMRRWLRAGGTVWVMADRVDLSSMDRLLGEDWGVGAVDKLSRVRMHVGLGADGEANLLTGRTTRRGEGMRHDPVVVEQPIPFARIDAPGYEILLSLDGWPVLLTRRVGAGRIVITTVGSRLWTDPRAEAVAHALGRVMYPSDEQQDLAVFEPGMADDFTGSFVGYRVASRQSIGLVLGVYLVVFVALGLWWRRGGKSERVGTVGVVLAVVAAATLAAIGYGQRGKAEPTNALLQLVHVEDGSVAATVRGTMQMFAPFERQAELASKRGGFAWPRGLAGTGPVRRLMWTDLDYWQWQQLQLSGGASEYVDFDTTAELIRPLRAAFELTDEGLVGELRWPDGLNPSDLVLITPAATMALNRQAAGDGLRATATGDDVLPGGSYTASGMVSDAQRRRNAFIRKMVKAGWPARPMLVAWTEPIDEGLEREVDVVRDGAAMWTVPLSIKPTEPGQSVRAPWPLVTMRPLREVEGMKLAALVYDHRNREWLRTSTPGAFAARFDLPDAAAPLRPNQATLHINIAAIGRTVRILGVADGGPIELASIESPDGLREVDLPLERLDGPLDSVTLVVDVGPLADPTQGLESQSGMWQIHQLALDVTGVVAPAPTDTAP